VALIKVIIITVLLMYDLTRLGTTLVNKPLIDWQDMPRLNCWSWRRAGMSGGNLWSSGGRTYRLDRQTDTHTHTYTHTERERDYIERCSQYDCM